MIWLLAAGVVLAQTKKEPVDWSCAWGAKLIRVGVERRWRKSGDILFAGDAMKTGSVGQFALYCPAKRHSRWGHLAMRCSDRRRLRSGGKVLDPKPIASCFLPRVVRVAVAVAALRGQHDTRPQGSRKAKLTPPDQWPAARAGRGVRQGSGGRQAIKGAMVGRAAYRKYNLLANASRLQKIGDQWKDAVWVKADLRVVRRGVGGCSCGSPPAGGSIRAADRRFKYQRLPRSSGCSSPTPTPRCSRKRAEPARRRPAPRTYKS
jgi:hypothetical protein